MCAFASTCFCLRVAAVAGCPDYQHYATAALAQIDRLAEAAADPAGVLDGLGAEEDTHSVVPGLCLSECPEQIARPAASRLGSSQGAEWLAHDAVSGSRFSLCAKLISLVLVLVSRREQCWSCHLDICETWRDLALAQPR